MPLSAVADAETPQLAREVAVMKRLNHPNVVKLFEVRAVVMRI
jgi:serine/threonine protein kinase